MSDKVVSINSARKNWPIVMKTVDGELVECVDVDALSPADRERYFREAERQSQAVTPPSTVVPGVGK